MTVFKKVQLGLFTGLIVASFPASQLLAADVYPVVTDINVGVAEIFGTRATNPFGGLYTVNSNATLNGNAVFGITQPAISNCCHGETVVVSFSNGENGFTGLEETDIPNATPANSVFTTIGNASGKLENGNVIRLSAWFRSDPANPITSEPQVAPILKMEYWTEALSTVQDSNLQQAFPTFGDRLFDQDQQGYAIGIPDPPAYVDINNDGTAEHEPGITPASGRLFGLSSSQWTRASVTHTVNDDDFLGIGGPSGFAFDDVTKVESIKGVIFLGHFATATSTTGPGTLLVDNMLIEVFKDAAAVTANANPSPTLSEGLPGDYNQNNTVDAADYTVWRNNLGSTAALPNDSSAGVGPDDYDRWKTNFGMTSPGAGAGSLGASAVPEPATLLLAMAILLSGVVAHRPKR